LDAEQVDAGGRATAARHVRQLGREREGGVRGGGATQHAEQLRPDRVHDPVGPVRRVVALGEQGLLDGAERRELRGVGNYLGTVLFVAAVRLDDERAAVQRRQQLAGVRRG